MRQSLKKSVRSILNNFSRSTVNKEKKTMTMADRSDYKTTWDLLAGSKRDAYVHVAGHDDEGEFQRAALYTVEILEKSVGVKPTDTILEIGCGVGRVGKALSPLCHKWIGTDISGQMISYAGERLAGLDNIELVELGATGLREIPSESVDVVYCTVVFMHLLEWDRYKYVEESFRVLKPGGRCFFDNVDIISDHGWEIFTIGYSIDPASRPAHLSMTSSGDELQTYAQKAGFQDVSIHRWDAAWVGVTGVKPK
jgi:ubiquinone/menaquinone biosynthesis C-methylase UbiE